MPRGGAARLFWPDWDRVATDVVAVPRAEAGRNSDDHGLRLLVSWAATEVTPSRSVRPGLP